MKDVLKAVVFGGLFLIPFLPLYVANEYFFPFITGKNFAFRIIIEIVVAAWVLLALMDKQYRPRFSWIMAGLATLLVVSGISTLLAQDPHTSFWSNYERMDGYITLLHVFGLVLVMGSVMRTDAVWNRWMTTAVSVAALVALYGIGQHSGFIGQVTDRVDSRLGNAAYMAVYMLFNIFFSYILILRYKLTWQKVLFGFIALTLAYTLLLTGTRGTFLGLVGGSVVTIAYIALFARRFPHLRRYAIGGVAIIAILGAGFFALRAADYQPQNQALQRILDIQIQKDLQTRSTIWGMALAGVKERPVFGWGSGNFNFVFNAQYKPELWNQEQWFDRVHDIFLDWLIAGGVVGLLAYLSVMAALVYYLFVVPVVLKRESIFSVPEQAILLGLLAGYLIHNLVVFDNIISYIFYAALLALVHNRIATPIGAIDRVAVREQTVTQFAMPIVIIVTGFVVYMVNVPGIQAAGDIIDAMRAPTAKERLTAFHNAIETGSFAQQEIIEQLTQQAMTVVQSSQVSDADKQLFVQRTELELLRLEGMKPGDARIENFISSFYRTIGALPQAREHAAMAAELSPGKPSLKIEQAIVEIQAGDLEAARTFAEEAYNMAPANPTAVVIYASVLYRLGENELARSIVTDDQEAGFALNDYALSSVNQAEDYEFLAQLYEIRIARQPSDAQARASLAFLYYQLDEPEKAVAVLRTAATDIPSFAEKASCYADNIEAGIDPSTPCTVAE